MTKVSIIIPFNNVENYIRECLVSVVNQTLEDIEIICVNDASSDNSRNIVEEFAVNDKRIKIIDIPEKKGQGYARNRALEIAQGEYIGFVDSDDKVELDMFSVLYEKAKTNDNDITICQAREYDDINDKYILTDYYSLNMMASMGDKVFTPEETKDFILDINVVIWNKIYKREYLKRINGRFPEGYIYEDLPFFFATYLPAKRVQIVWKNLYIYRINRKNSTMQQFNKKVLDRPPMVSLTYEIMKKVSFLDELRKEIQAWIINDLFYRYTILKDNFQNEYFFLMKKIFKNLEIEDINDEFWKKVYHFENYLLVINSDFESFNQKIFNKYLDVHGVEFSIYAEVAKKSDEIFAEITRNYEYTNRLHNELKEKIEDLNNFLNETVKSSNEEIIKNTVSINSISSKLSDISKIINEKENNLISLINTVKTEVQSFVDGKISDELAQNCEHLKQTSENLKLELENVRNIIKDSVKENKQVTEEPKHPETNDIQLYPELLNNIYDEKINNINIEVNNRVSSLYSQCAIDNEKISKIIQDSVKNLETLLNNKLDSQKQYYENEIKKLNERIDKFSQNA